MSIFKTVRVKSAAERRRLAVRDAVVPGAEAYIWPRDKETGWAKIPRYLPIILRVLAQKTLSGELDVTGVYLDLFARNINDGAIEVIDEAEHAGHAGFTGKRGVRSWQERVRKLEELGFLTIAKAAHRDIGLIIMRHPGDALFALRGKRLVPDEWWLAYQKRLAESGQSTVPNPLYVPTFSVVPGGAVAADDEDDDQDDDAASTSPAAAPTTKRPAKSAKPRKATKALSGK